MSKKSINDIRVPTYDDLFTNEEQRQEAKLEKIMEIPVEDIQEFKNHPFRVRNDEQMSELVKSVSANGILVPVLVRPHPNSHGYEMISGHRRMNAAMVNGQEKIQAIVRELTDDQATIIMVDSNIQRENILPTERGFAYKLKLDAMKHQGKQISSTSTQVAQKSQNKWSVDILSEEVKQSRDQIRRFIRLTELIEPLRDMVDGIRSDGKKIARLFNVSTDFLLGETNIPDRKNYDIAELGLSVEAAKNLYTGRVNTEVVNLLLENARFAELTYRISQYFDDTFASGIAAQNAMLSTLSNLLRTKVKTPEAAKAAKDISLRRKPVYQGDLDDIEMYFMVAVKEIKKGIGSHYAEQEAMSKKVAEKMFTELTKGQDVQHPTITAEQLTDAMLDSVSGMNGATPEALEQLRNGLLGILQSAAERENAHEADE